MTIRGMTIRGRKGRGRAERGLRGSVLALLLLGGCATAGGGAAVDDTASAGGAAARRLEAVRHSPPELRAFLARMPKGADLHSHLTGAVYAETYVAVAAANKLCFSRTTQSLTPPPCRTADKEVSLEGVETNPTLYAQVVNALSTRNALPVSGFSLHDQFFVTFGRFRAANDDVGLLLAEVVDRAGRQGVQHVELMVSFGTGDAGKVGTATPWTGDLPATADALTPKLAALVPTARAGIDSAEARMRALLGCGTPAAKPGCGVSVRYLQQVTRTMPPGPVFAQTLFNALLAQADPRVVGLNFVAPEDYPVALADYDLHMRMIAEVRRRLPQTNVALHAGELTLGLVPPEELRSHIRKAVEVAGARRIGHGVDVMYEDDPQSLLRTMAERKVAVEINLTSNDVILGVAGKAHPFPVYRAAGVPTVISTDDEGVSRIDLTHELGRAVTEFGLTYADLVALARNSLEYSFLPGASLWRDGGRPVEACAVPPAAQVPPACRTFLDGSEKARVQWRLEQALAAFDREVATQDP
ncbi:adenosine deaminase family protein [Azospirillum thermophilum]|nr:adenosine deaminase [Azospirillum thermophilum]